MDGDDGGGWGFEEMMDGLGGQIARLCKQLDIWKDKVSDWYRKLRKV